MGYQYKPRSNEEMVKRQTQTGSSYISFIEDKFKTFSPKKENAIRILPPTWENPKHYGFDIWVHWSVGPQNAAVLCPLKMANERCPMCDEHAKRQSAGDQKAYDFKASRRVLVWLLDRKNDKEPGPYLWAMGWTVDRDISKASQDRETGQLYYIDHPDQGYDVYFDTEGERPNINYNGFQLARRASAVDAKIMEYIIANPVDSCLVVRSYNEILDLMTGGAVEAVTPVQSAAPQPTAAVQPAPVPVAVPVVVQPPTATVTDLPPFCSKSITYKNTKLGCTIAAGHIGDCNFERELEQVQPVAVATPAPTPQPVAVAAPTPVAVAAPQPVAAPVAETSAAVVQQSKASALRERFKKQTA